MSRQSPQSLSHSFQISSACSKTWLYFPFVSDPPHRRPPRIQRSACWGICALGSHRQSKFGIAVANCVLRAGCHLHLWATHRHHTCRIGPFRGLVCFHSSMVPPVSSWTDWAGSLRYWAHLKHDFLRFKSFWSLDCSVHYYCQGQITYHSLHPNRHPFCRSRCPCYRVDWACYHRLSYCHPVLLSLRSTCLLEGRLWILVERWNPTDHPWHSQLVNSCA